MTRRRNSSLAGYSSRAERGDVEAELAGKAEKLVRTAQYLVESSLQGWVGQQTRRERLRVGDAGFGPQRFQIGILDHGNDRNGIRRQRLIEIDRLRRQEGPVNFSCISGKHDKVPHGND